MGAILVTTIGFAASMARYIRVSIAVGIALLAAMAAWAEPKSPERMRAEELVTKGMDLSDGSKEEEQYYLEARDIDPGYNKVNLNLGLVYYDRRQYDIALTYLRRYVDGDSSALDGLYQLAATYDNLRQDNEALEHYTRYLQAATGQEHFTDDERRYIQEAANAVRRLSTVQGPKTVTASASAPAVATTAVSREEQVSMILSHNEDASVEEMVQILSRPRARSVRFRLESAPVLAVTGIHFAKASDKILPESFDLLDRIASALLDKRIAGSKITIHGHASTEGDEEPNLRLSERRAGAIKNYLVSEYKIPTDLVDVRAWGEQDPLIAPDKAEEQRKLNRRVEFERNGSVASESGAPVVTVVKDESKPPQ